ncbi:hypothetical protein [Elizabethkingia miricola]|uniref:hypothetical protein n=1 Tax=Elizabethkingia miricola TaxID=172045 RepID=UPI003891FE54
MKFFRILLLSVLFLQCKKEEKISDRVTFQYDKSLPLKFQEFNEGEDEQGGRIIYYGQKHVTIPVKYYFEGIPPPPPPPSYKAVKPSSFDIQRDSLISKYFNGFLDINFDDKALQYDSLNNKNFIVEARYTDTIPLYTISYQKNIVKAYKSFPIFLKNISGKNLRLNEYDIIATYEILNQNKKWQIIFNNNWFICGTDYTQYFSFKNQNMMILAIPFLHGSYKTKMRIRFRYAKSNEFDVSVDPKIFKKQKRSIYLD